MKSEKKKEMKVKSVEFGRKKLMKKEDKDRDES
jgi:hypothetical protein